MRNRNVFIISTISFILLITASILVNINQYNIYEEKIDNIFKNIVGVIKEEYPEVKEEDIIKLLDINNNEKVSKNGEELLKKYGIDNDVIYGLKDMEKSIVIHNFIIILISFIIYMAILISNIIKDKNEIKRINKYIYQISKKDYELKIDENSEYELSRLKNDLYKITVMLKEEAENSKKMKKDYQTFMDDISHQLKTPLTSISIMLDNILENPEMDKETRYMFLNEISRQIKNINWLVISLLKFAKIDSNTIEFEKKEIFVKDLIEDVRKNLEIPLEIKEQKIEIKGDKECKIMGDYNWQKEALTNIVKNCIEHTESHKKIYINYEENNFYTKIKIRDEGKGIKKEEIKHIFDRFFKGSNSSDDSIGIGLALSKSIIEKGNGYIICTSEVNKGTIFEIKYMKK